MIEVDGGIDIPNMPEVITAGAQVLVAGSAIFGDPDPARKLKEMLAIAAPPQLSFERCLKEFLNAQMAGSSPASHACTAAEKKCRLRLRRPPVLWNGIASYTRTR